jgi:hypothetical protein
VVGWQSLFYNTTGSSNVAIGDNSQLRNTTGTSNAAVGSSALYNSTTGNENTAVGSAALTHNTIGSGNTAVGANALYYYCKDWERITCPDNRNTGIGYWAGSGGIYDALGADNTFVGSYTGPYGRYINNSTAIGARAVVMESNSLVLGSINGVNGATSSVNVGIGTFRPLTPLHVATGDIYDSQAGSGVIVKSPDGTRCARIGIDNSGALVATAVTCP